MKWKSWEGQVTAYIFLHLKNQRFVCSLSAGNVLLTEDGVVKLGNLILHIYVADNHNYLNLIFHHQWFCKWRYHDSPKLDVSSQKFICFHHSSWLWFCINCLPCQFVCWYTLLVQWMRFFYSLYQYFIRRTDLRWYDFFIVQDGTRSYSSHGRGTIWWKGRHFTQLCLVNMFDIRCNILEQISLSSSMCIFVFWGGCMVFRNNLHWIR